MANTQVLLLVLWLAVCVGLCRSLGEDAADIAKAKAEEVKHDCAETTQHAKEKTESMADWTYDKFRENKESARQAAQNMKDKAGDAASRVTETMKSAASGASEYASQKSGDAKEKLSREMAYDRATEAYNAVDDEIIRMPADKASTTDRNAEGNMAESMGYDGRDKAAEESYDQAKHRVGKAYGSAKDTITEEAKVMYEDAKEKASQATGDLGAKMRRG